MLAYSIDGLTRVVYAAAFTTLGHECMLRLRKLMVRLALAEILLINVSGPAQVITDGNSQVLAVCCYFKFMVMQHVIVFNCFSLSSNM